MALFDADGNEIAGSMTAEEVQAKIAATTQQVKQEEEQARASLQTELSVAQAQLKETNSALDGKSSKDQSFASLRKTADEQAATIKALEGKIGESEQRVTSIVTDRTKNEVIGKLAGSDRELADKIKINYERLMKLEPAVTEDVINKVAVEAYKLSVDTVEPSVLRSVSSGKPMGGPAYKQDENINPEVAQWAPSFGLSADDLKKYGGKK